ncbi:hypothetical protein J31TS4_18720 [Paenibacillus sp. J31TS4]|nr:hypothetical protein J31TS4_18720 [Paenibacillus sp. J31TS4]
MKCRYPGCYQPSTKSWALVELCDEHQGDIRRETDKYYRSSGGVKQEGRINYLKIAELIPWSRRD